MKAIIHHVVASEFCPACHKEIETTDFMDLICGMAQVDIEECPFCGVDLSGIDAPEDYEEDEDDE